MTIYLVYKDSDMIEGRGPMDLVTAFLKEQDANDFIDKQYGVMGRQVKWSKEKFGDWKVEPFVAHGTLEEYEKFRLSEIREAALSKLTKEEKAALGL